MASGYPAGSGGEEAAPASKSGKQRTGVAGGSKKLQAKAKAAGSPAEADSSSDPDSGSEGYQEVLGEDRSASDPASAANSSVASICAQVCLLHGAKGCWLRVAASSV